MRKFELFEKKSPIQKKNHCIYVIWTEGYLVKLSYFCDISFFIEFKKHEVGLLGAIKLAKSTLLFTLAY